MRLAREAAPPASDPPPSLIPPKPLRPYAGPAPLTFREGTRAPYGVRWYGVTSLYGHFRNFVSRFIAAESVDSRDWMRPNRADDLLESVLEILAARSPDARDAEAHEGESRRSRSPARAASVTEALGRSIVLDFVADTGDDRDTSHAVGRMLAHDYVIENVNGEPELLPRGELLMFGGDVAYPVGTADEIHRRLTQPWNEALRSARVRGPTKKRVLLGVPGNHDWYDGLDGFGRLFRHSVDRSIQRAGPRAEPTLLDSIAKLGTPLKRAARDRRVGLVVRQLHLDEVGGFFRIFASVGRSLRAFFQGAAKKRRRRLVLHGYVAVQEASYFVLPLARGLDLWGVDRQLGRMDFRQRAFFQKSRREAPDRRLLFLAADPASAFAEPNVPGVDLLRACRLDMRRDPLLYISGDFHHYERRTFAPSMHVIAGGGGAFLHGTRINPGPQGAPDAAYPSAEVSRRLVYGVPFKLLWGRGGYLVHVAAALLAFFELWARGRGATVFTLVATGVAIAIAALLYAIAGPRLGQRARAALTVTPFALALGALPAALAIYAPPLFPRIAGDTVVVTAYVLAATFLFGLYLMVVALLGFEHQQAFTVLGHHGFKHFVRMRISPDGRIEGWVIGKDDPLTEGDPALIDHWVWDGARAPSVDDETTSAAAAEAPNAAKSTRLKAKR